MRPGFHIFNGLLRLGKRRRCLLLKATVLLTGASAAVALLPFRRAILYGCVPLGRCQAATEIADNVWAIEKATKYMPWRTMCIEKGLAIQRMLRSAGVDALLHYGARQDPALQKLEAHVWVTVGGQAIIGGEEAPHFAELAVFP